jgi:hypothetical protein
MFSIAKSLQQPFFVESVGGVDEDVASIVPNQTKFSSLSNIRSVHLEFGNVTLSNVVNVSQLVVVTTPKGGIYD